MTTSPQHSAAHHRRRHRNFVQKHMVENTWLKYISEVAVVLGVSACMYLPSHHPFSSVLEIKVLFVLFFLWLSTFCALDCIATYNKRHRWRTVCRAAFYVFLVYFVAYYFFYRWSDVPVMV